MRDLVYSDQGSRQCSPDTYMRAQPALRSVLHHHNTRPNRGFSSCIDYISAQGQQLDDFAAHPFVVIALRLSGSFTLAPSEMTKAHIHVAQVPVPGKDL